MIHLRGCFFTKATIIAVVISCLNTAAVASSPQKPTTDAFYGMRLGESTIELRAELGTPTLTGFNEHAVFWSYQIDHNRAWRVAIIQHGHVAAIYVRQAFGHSTRLGDGTGLAIGDQIADMFAKRGQADPLVYSTYSYATPGGVYRLYEIVDGKVNAIGVTRWYDYPLPFLSTWDNRDGETLYRAVVLTKTDTSPDAAEKRFFGTQLCDHTAAWRILTHKVIVLESRTYDRVLAACSRPVFRHNFYFDVTGLISQTPPAH